jgi:hypothetical protein
VVRSFTAFAGEDKMKALFRIFKERLFSDNGITSIQAVGLTAAIATTLWAGYFVLSGQADAIKGAFTAANKSQISCYEGGPCSATQLGNGTGSMSPNSPQQLTVRLNGDVVGSDGTVLAHNSGLKPGNYTRDPQGNWRGETGEVLGASTASESARPGLRGSASTSDASGWDLLRKAQLALTVLNPLYRMGASELILNLAKDRPEFTSLQPFYQGRAALKSIGEYAQLIPLLTNGYQSIQRAQRGEIDSPEVFFGEVFAFSANTINDIITGPGRAAAKLIFGEEVVKNSPIVYLDTPISGRDVVDAIRPIVEPFGEKYIQPYTQPFFNWVVSVRAR